MSNSPAFGTNLRWFEDESVVEVVVEEEVVTGAAAVVVVQVFEIEVMFDVTVDDDSRKDTP